MVDNRGGDEDGLLEPHSKQTLLLLVGIVLVGIAARIATFGDSLLWDEGSTHFVVHNRTFVDMIDYVEGEQEVTPPLYFIFAWFTNRIADTPEMLRLPSLVAGLLTIPLTYLLGKLTLGRNQALFAAALVALSPFMIFYSAEARPYALALFFVLVSSIALVKALKTNRVHWWVVFAFATAAAMYTHYTALFVLAGQFVWAFALWPDGRKRLLLAGLGSVILYVPWLSNYKADDESPGADVIGALFPFSFDSIPSVLSHWSYGHPFQPVSTIPGYLIGSVLVAGILVAVGGLLFRLYREREWPPSKLTGLPFVLALCAPVGTIIYSAVSVSVFLPRNLTTSWVGFALVLAALVLVSRNRVVRYVAGGLVIAAFVAMAIKAQDSQYRRLDYQQAIRYVESVQPDEPVIVDISGPQPAPTSPIDIARNQESSDAEIIRLGQPTLESQVAAIAPGGAGRYSVLPMATMKQVVDQSLREARGREIFLVSPYFGSREDEIWVGSSIEWFEEVLGKQATLVNEKLIPGMPDGLNIRTFQPTGYGG